jgi:CO dehydrogenase maturation factor
VAVNRSEPISVSVAGPSAPQQRASDQDATATSIPSDRVRVAFVGKGGSGKSTIAGTFARLLARSDSPVLALDSDPLPGMPYALGIHVDDRPIPDDVVVDGPTGGPTWVLRPDLDAGGVIERYGTPCPDGVAYLQFGNLRGHLSTLRRAQFAWSQVVRDLDDRWHVVGDLPGGTRQAMAGWAKYASTVCVVVEPTLKSLHSANRLLNLRHATFAPSRLLVVANKVGDADDVRMVERRLGLTVAASIPADHGVRAADRAGQAPLDADATGGFTDAVAQLVVRVRRHTGGPTPTEQDHRQRTRPEQDDRMDDR